MSKLFHRVVPLVAACVGACFGVPGVARAQEAVPAVAESAEAREARMGWWREARFGMFIHWGLYAIPAGVWEGRVANGPSEWLPQRLEVQVADYEPLRARFNPVMFDADAWVGAAKRAGMKYIVITTKHHDGFAMFDSAVSEWDIMSTPFARDPLKELAAACEREGIRLGFYHSIMDWNHPDYVPRPKWDVRPRDGADMNRYVAYMKAQLAELLTNYGPVSVLWFDGEWEGSWTSARGKDLDAYVRGFQPSVIVNNRVDKGRMSYAGLNREGTWAGDFGTPEQEVPAKGLPGTDWESCLTMNGSWGYHSEDHAWKSSAELIRTLVDIASKGGNLLLNVGPTADGLIPEASLARFADIARWMDINGEAIYGTVAGPFERLDWGRCTAKAGVLYLHVFDWPEGGVLRVPGLLNALAGDAALLGMEGAVAARREGDDVVVGLPEAAPAGQPVWVVRLAIVGEAEVVALPEAVPVEVPEGGVAEPVTGGG